MTKNNPFFLGWQIQNHRQKMEKLLCSRGKGYKLKQIIAKKSFG
jgi:hypothetical protein